MQPVIVFLRLRAQELMQIAKSSTDKEKHRKARGNESGDDRDGQLP
jgi:hypothetical protein